MMIIMITAPPDFAMIQEWIDMCGSFVRYFLAILAEFRGCRLLGLENRISCRAKLVSVDSGIYIYIYIYIRIHI